MKRNYRSNARGRLLRTTALLVPALLVAACSTGASGGDGGGGGVRIGTAGEGGTYYYLGTAVSQQIKKSTSLSSSSVATAGGTENLRRVASGDLDLAFATVLDLEDVLEGGEQDVEDFKLLATGHLTVMQPMVRADTGIETLEEMAQPGRRLGIGEPGSAIQPLSEIYLAAHGLTPDDVDGFEVSQSDAAASMKDGQLEGAYFGGGVPLSAVTDLTTTGDYTLLPLDEATLEAYQEATAIEETTVPADTYNGQTEDIKTVGIPTLLVVRSDMDEKTAKTVVQAIQENSESIAEIHPAGKEYTAENAFIGRDYIEGKVGLQYHPGAIDWYKQQNVWPGE